MYCLSTICAKNVALKRLLIQAQQSLQIKHHYVKSTLADILFSVFHKMQSCQATCMTLSCQLRPAICHNQNIKAGIAVDIWSNLTFQTEPLAVMHS